MTPVSFDQALQLAAMVKALEWYCRKHELPEPDFESGRIDPKTVCLHGTAWAWARENRVGFLPETDDETSRFLIRLLTRGGGGRGPCEAGCR